MIVNIQDVYKRQLLHRTVPVITYVRWQLQLRQTMVTAAHNTAFVRHINALTGSGRHPYDVHSVTLAGSYTVHMTQSHNLTTHNRKPHSISNKLFFFKHSRETEAMKVSSEIC